MNVILGVTVCLFCFLSFSLVASFITVRLTTMVGRKRNLTLILSSSLCFLLLSLLCSLIWPRQVAFADESDLPSNFEQVALTRSSPDEIVVTEGDTARLVNVVKSGASESSETSELWEKALDALLVGPCTQAEATAKIMDDLAWRYYHYPDKREKVPVVPGGEFGQGDRFQPLNHYSNYGEFLQKNRMVYDTSAFIFYYHLVELNSGKSWNSGTWNYEDLYRDWYNYYEDIQEEPEIEFGAEVVIPYNNQNVSMRVYDSYSSNSYVNKNASTISKVTLVLSNSAQTSIMNLLSDGYSAYIDMRYASYVGNISCYMIKGDVHRNKDSSNRYIGFSPDVTGASFKYINVTGSGTKLYYEDGNVKTRISSVNVGNESTITSISIGANPYAMGTPIGGVSGGGGTTQPTDPVYSPPIDKPATPVEPTPTPVNTPETPNVTNVNVTQTDVDLQPIIDAISVLNTNTVNHFNGLETFIGDWFSALFDMLANWRDMWIEYTGALYEDLTDYLWNIERLLNQLLLQETSEPVVKPTIDDGNSADQQATVNLELLKKKFPTSIPWDLYGILTLLETAPVAPSFTLPVVMTEYTITIDLSDFSPMAAVSRRMSVLLFAVGLLMNTKRIASIDIGANHGN